MRRVELVTAALEFVAVVELPPFVSPRMPDVVLWGSRVFQRTVRLDADERGATPDGYDGRDAWHYVEAFAIMSLTPSPGLPREAPPALPPVDRSAVVLTDGSPVTADHRETRPDGQQKGYIVLTAEERAKGFVRPVRRSYRHLKCGRVTMMGVALAETYARDPKFYSATFCATCGVHLPVGAAGEFVWDGTEERVGT